MAAAVESPPAPEDEDEFLFVEASHSKLVLSGLNAMRSEGSLCDITLCAAGEDFRCHRIVLAVCSQYFRAMFAGHMAESTQEKVSIHHVDGGAMRLLIDYAYMGEVRITHNNVQTLLAAANLLEVLPVRDACCQFMLRHMDESNVLGIHHFAGIHACTDLARVTKKFTLLYFTEVAQQEEFLELEQEKLIELLSDDSLCVEKEEIVVEAVMRWLHNDEETRAPGFVIVLNQCRLPLLSPYFLVDTVERESCVLSTLPCMSLINEAKTYHLLKDRRASLSTVRTQPRKGRRALVTFGRMGGKYVLGVHKMDEPLRFTHLRTLYTEHKGTSWPGYTVHEDKLYVLDGKFLTEVTCTGVRSLISLVTTKCRRPGVFVLGSRLYIIGGEGASMMMSQSLTDENSGWITENVEIPHPLSATACAVVGDTAYCAGGSCHGRGFLNTLYSWRVGDASWTLRAPMTQARRSHGLVDVGGHVYALGGKDGMDHYLASVECYAPDTDTWSAMPDMLQARAGMGVATYGDLILTMGGFGQGEEPNVSGQVVIFDTVTRQWSACVLTHDITPINDERLVVHAAAVLPQGEEEISVTMASLNLHR